MQKVGLLFVLIISFISCSRSTHFEQDTRFSNNNWIKFNDLVYTFPVEAGKEYTFFGELLTDSTFQQRKIEIGFYLYLPDGSERLEDKTIRVLDFDLNPLGEKKNNEFLLPIDLKNSLQIKESGSLKVVITNHSQYLDNFGFAGFRLKVIEK